MTSDAEHRRLGRRLRRIAALVGVVLLLASAIAPCVLGSATTTSS